MKKLLTLLLALVAVISVIGAGCQLAGSSGTVVTAEEAQKAKTLIEQSDDICNRVYFAWN